MAIVKRREKRNGTVFMETPMEGLVLTLYLGEVLDNRLKSRVSSHS
jgi:hypothetical protein